MMHMKKSHFTAYKTAAMMLNFLGQLSIGKNNERGGYFCQCPRLRLNSIDLKNLVHTVNTGFLSRADDTLCIYVFIVLV